MDIRLCMCGSVYNTDCECGHLCGLCMHGSVSVVICMDLRLCMQGSVYNADCVV